MFLYPSYSSKYNVNGLDKSLGACNGFSVFFFNLMDEKNKHLWLRPRQGNLRLVFRLFKSYARQASHK